MNAAVRHRLTMIKGSRALSAVSNVRVSNVRPPEITEVGMMPNRRK
jgi:hypothetical protein